MTTGVSVTLDNLDADIVDRLHIEASRRGVEVGVVIRQMIRDGLRPEAVPSAVQTHHDLDSLAGTWTAEEAETFLSATANLREFDEDLWK
jgi:plasmid stability protein